MDPDQRSHLISISTVFFKRIHPGLAGQELKIGHACLPNYIRLVTVKF